MTDAEKDRYIADLEEACACRNVYIDGLLAEVARLTGRTFAETALWWEQGQGVAYKALIMRQRDNREQPS